MVAAAPRYSSATVFSSSPFTLVPSGIKINVNTRSSGIEDLKSYSYSLYV